MNLRKSVENNTKLIELSQKNEKKFTPRPDNDLTLESASQRR